MFSHKYIVAVIYEPGARHKMLVGEKIDNFLLTHGVPATSSNSGKVIDWKTAWSMRDARRAYRKFSRKYNNSKDGIYPMDLCTNSIDRHFHSFWGAQD